jgi:hypothetical protein
LPAALARFSSSFTLEMSQLCGATGVAYPMQIEVITGGFGTMLLVPKIRVAFLEMFGALIFV